MREYVTRAVVLEKAARNDADARYSFFTERFGKIVAKAKSSRKITSKLAGHLEPGTVSAVRIIEAHGTQVVDALAMGRARIPLADLAFLNQLLGEWEPDMALWHEVTRPAHDAAFSWANALALLGWDPRGATCATCGGVGPDHAARHFFIPRQEFFCVSCASKMGAAGLIFI